MQVAKPCDKGATQVKQGCNAVKQGCNAGAIPRASGARQGDQYPAGAVPGRSSAAGVGPARRTCARLLPALRLSLRGQRSQCVSFLPSPGSVSQVLGGSWRAAARRPRGRRRHVPRQPPALHTVVARGAPAQHTAVVSSCSAHSPSVLHPTALLCTPSSPVVHVRVRDVVVGGEGGVVCGGGRLHTVVTPDACVRDVV